MYRTQLARALAAVATITAGWLAAAPAHAHITMKAPLTSRGGDQKSFPCDGAKGAGDVYTFEPGSTITLSLTEDIPHPGYFRFAFDDDGEDAFLEPKSIKPVDPTRQCPYDKNDQCGEPDFCNLVSDSGATVLWDNVDPHLRSEASFGKAYSWNIKLPDVECDNCTLQVLQIMEDLEHGAYCPTGSCTDNTAEDIYHRCIDIKLKKGATNSPGVTTDPVNVKGVECSAAGGSAGSGAAGSGTAGAASPEPTAGAGVGGSASGATGGAPATAGAASTTTAGVSGGTAGARGPVATAGSASTTRAGSPAPVATAGSAATSTPGTPVPSTGAASGSSGGGCSVASRSNASAGLDTAAWLLLTAAVTFFRRRRFQG